MVKVDNQFENNPIKIGQNAVENTMIISDSTQTDMWFHLADFPSCHLIIENSTKYPISTQMIQYCAEKVKENTKYKNIPKVKVNYTSIKNVHKTKTPGLVNLTGKIMHIVV
jgi:predicted ribosome quality control (RQC) complex YloA/Tae2 family protein